MPRRWSRTWSRPSSRSVTLAAKPLAAEPCNSWERPMSRSGADSPLDPDSSLGWRFALRRVGFGETRLLLRESIAPFRAAPLRLVGMFLLIWIGQLLISRIPTYGIFLNDIVAAVAYTGYTFALDAATRSEAPSFQHLGVVLRFGRDQLILLALAR